MPEAVLRSVMFMPGHTDHLAETSPYISSEQLEGVLELLDFANAVVLNDRVAVGGASTVATQEHNIGTLLRREAEQYNYLEIVGSQKNVDFNLGPYEEAVGAFELFQKLTDLTRRGAPDSEVEAVSKEANERQAWSYIMLADSVEADYVAERKFGIHALATYQGVTGRAAHAQRYEKFLSDLTARMSQEARADSVATEMPSFLLEALRNSDSLKGVLASLRDIRDSTAARQYRDLVRVTRTSSPRSAEWRDASSTLDQQASAAFGNEGMRSRGSLRWARLMIGLTGVAVAALFPDIRVVMSAAGVLAPFAIDELDKYTRNRSNIFELYKQSLGTDLHQELKRLFPHIAFERDHLNFFLEKKHFGWGPELEQQLRRAQVGRNL